MAALALLFLIKTAVLALFVTPLWEVPDEPGHYAYVLDLTERRGFPVYGKTPLPAEVIASWKVSAAERPPFNWVAQHPPLYHLLAAPFPGSAASEGDGVRLRAPRSSPPRRDGALISSSGVSRGDGDPAFASPAWACLLPVHQHLLRRKRVLVALAMGPGAFLRARAPGKFSDGMRMGSPRGGWATSWTRCLGALALVLRQSTSREDGTKLEQGWRSRRQRCPSRPLGVAQLTRAGTAAFSGRSFRMVAFRSLREQPASTTCKNYWSDGGREPASFAGLIEVPPCAFPPAGISGCLAAAWLGRARSGARTFVACSAWSLRPPSRRWPPGGPAKHFLYSLLAELHFFCIPRY